MPRPQFGIRTLLWLTMVVAAFLGGAAWQNARIQTERERLMRQIKSLEKSNVNGYEKMRQLIQALKEEKAKSEKPPD